MKLLQSDVVPFLKYLTPRERKIIELIVLDNETVYEVAEYFSVTKEKIGKIRSKALNKLRYRIMKESRTNYRNFKNPTEAQEQKTLCEYLDRAGIFYLHVPNELIRTKRQASRNIALGLKPGASDFLILDHPPLFPSFVGVALELKRRTGAKPTKNQEAFLLEMEKRSWFPMVCNGAGEAIQRLKELGYK